jgi:plastocyanin
MLRKTTLMAGLATLFISTPVQADEHKITVLPDAYFPETTYVPAGDAIVFVNETDGVLTVIELDQTWETEEFGIDQTESLAITAEMAKSFFHDDLANEDGGTTIKGFINFGAAPLDQASSAAAEETVAE